MIRILDFQLRLQKPDTGAILYPPVKSFSTVDSLPFENSPSASIQVLSSSTLSDLQTVSLVEFDDIVKLQGGIRYHPDDTIVYADLFEGRVQNMSKATDDGNSVSLECVGHISEAFKILQKYDKAWTTATNIQDILAYINTQGYKLGRIEYNVADIESTVISEYEIEAYQLNLSDVLQDMEKLASYLKYFGTRQVYDKWGTLQYCYLTWKSIPTVPTQIYKVEEGTNRLISASVDVIGEDVATFRYVRGGTNDSNVQYAGDYGDSVAIAKYGPRDGIDTFTWVKSNTLCTTIATALVADSKDPYISIQAVLEGTLDAHIGDLVPVKFESLDIKGVTIDGNYPVMRVQHGLNEQGEFTTTLDLNKIKPDENLYRYSVTKQVKTCTVNQRLTQAAVIP